MDRPLRIFGECYPNNMWYEQWDNGTVFKGTGSLFYLMNFKSKLQNEIEIVTSQMQTAVQAVADGVDVSPDNWVATYDRFKYVDFSPMLDTAETKIISRSASHITGSFVSDVFTDLTYLCMVFAILFLYMLIHVWINILEDRKLKVTDFVYFIGNLVNQPFPKTIKVNRMSTLILIRTFDIFTLSITLMFCSTMIYKVMSTEQVGKLIDSLSQLERMKNKQIYIKRHSFVQDYIDDIKSLKSMRNTGSFITL